MPEGQGGRVQETVPSGSWVFWTVAVEALRIVGDKLCSKQAFRKLALKKGYQKSLK